MPEYEEMSFVRAYLRPGDLFIDVGANVGVYSLWAAETDSVTVLAFEPSSTTYRRVLENVQLNGLYDRVLLVRKAVGAESTVVDRKSTRLNSSHANISYAVFCLK